MPLNPNSACDSNSSGRSFESWATEMEAHLAIAVGLESETAI